MKKVLFKQIALSLIVTLLFFTNSGYSQSFSGKDFWFGYMANFDNVSPSQVYQVTIASEFANSGTISIPQAGYSVPFSVGANSSIKIDLPKNLVSNYGNNVVVAKTGVHVVANENCTVYAGNNMDFSSDEATIIPTNALGKVYDIIAYQHKVQGESVFLVCATEDNTKVTYNLNSGVSGNSNRKNDVTVTLNKGETFQFLWGFWVYFVPPNYFDFTGSTIIADKPVAVFGGASCSWVGECEACDHLYEEILPINKWANNFTLVPSRVRNTIPPNDIARIYAHENSNITVNGLPYTINASDFLDLELKTPLNVSSNKPINVTQYLTGSGCNGYGDTDPSVFMVLPSEQYASSYIFATSAFTRFRTNTATVIINTADVGTLRLNGSPLTLTTFTPIVGSTFSYGYVGLVIGSQYKLLSTNNTPFSLVVYGVGDTESYAYVAGGNLQNFCELISSDVTICSGQTATLNVVSPKLGTSPTFQWFKVPIGGALQGTGASFTTPILTANDSFYVQINSPSCVNDRLKVKVTVKPVSTSSFTIPTSVCMSKSVTINYSGTGIPTDIYNWNFDGGIIESGTGKGPYVIHWDTPGVKNISLTVDKNGCVSSVTTKSITVNDLPIINLSVLNPICFNENSGSITVNATGGTSPLSFSLNNVTFQTSNVFLNLTAGNYIIYVKDNLSCAVSKETSLINPTKLAIAGSSKAAACGLADGEIHALASGGTGVNYQFKIDTVGAVFKSSPDFLNLKANTYKIIIKDENGCLKDSTFSVKNLNGPTLSIATNKNSVSCFGDSTVKITASASGSAGPFKFKLDNGNQQDSGQFHKVGAGVHNIVVTDIGTGCIDIGQITITEPAKLLVDKIVVKDAYCDEANGIIETNGIGGTGVYMFSINGIDFQASNKFTGIDPANYPNGITVFIKDENYCMSSGIASIQQLGKPDVKVSTDKPTICRNATEQVQLSAINAVSFEWSPSKGLNDSNSPTPFANPDSTTTYTVVGTDERGCTNSAFIVITVDQPLAIPVATCGTSTTTSVVFNWSAVANAINYQVSEDGGITWKNPSSGSTGLSHSITGKQPDMPVDIAIRAVGINSCGNSGTRFMTCKTAKCTITSQILRSKSTICIGDTLHLFGKSNQAGVTYKWIPATGLSKDNIANPIASPKSTITYTLTVSDGVCESTKQITIGVKKLAKATFAYSKDGLKVNFYADSTNEINKYFWDYGDRSKNDTTKNSFREYNTSGTYDITLIVSNSCNADTIIFPITVKVGVKDSVGTIGLEENLNLNENNFSIFPNPFSNNINVKLYLEKPKKVSIVFADILGREVYSKIHNENLNTGNYLFTISTDEYQLSGKMIFVKIILDDKVYVHKLIKE